MLGCSKATQLEECCTAVTVQQVLAQPSAEQQGGSARKPALRAKHRHCGDPLHSRRARRACWQGVTMYMQHMSYAGREIAPLTVRCRDASKHVLLQAMPPLVAGRSTYVHAA
jgi:hypothetical protein